MGEGPDYEGRAADVGESIEEAGPEGGDVAPDGGDMVAGADESLPA